MAFNAQQTSRMRAAVLIIALAVVAVVAVFVVSGAFNPAVRSQEPAGSSADAAGSSESTGDGDTMESIDAQYGTATQALASQYESDPTNPSALLNLANGYFDWGAAAMNHAEGDSDKTHARDLLTKAIGYYDSYLEGNPGAKSAAVDRAICVFYTGDVDGAISALESLVSEDPSFAPAWANLGMFYEAQGSDDKAADAYQKAIDETDESDAYGVRSYAEERLSDLQDDS